MAFSKGLVNTSDNVEWGTPQALYDSLNEIFGFTLDPCASDENHKCDRYYTKEDDGLKQSWDGEKVFLNPPYKGIYAWMEKACSCKAKIVVAVVPAKTDAKWFHEFVYRKQHVDYVILRKRLKYNDYDGQRAPFGSMIVIFWKEMLTAYD